MAHTPKNARILVIDDEPDVREMLEFLLEEEGFSVDTAADATTGLARLAARDYDLLLLDLMLPDMSGMDVLKRIRKEDRELPVCMVTAHGSTSVAVEALKSGANDYFSKPFDNEKLILEIGRLIDARRLLKENTQLRRALKQRYAFPEIVGKSEKMLQVLDLVKQVASSRSTILITGETGTGKELIAKAIHMNSPRADNMFIAVNSGPFLRNCWKAPSSAMSVARSRARWPRIRATSKWRTTDRSFSTKSALSMSTRRPSCCA